MRGLIPQNRIEAACKGCLGTMTKHTTRRGEWFGIVLAEI